MHKNEPLRITRGAVCLAALAVAASLHAQTFQTVLDYQLAPGQSADGVGIYASPSGQVLSVGDASDASGTLQGLALTSDTTGLNWVLSDDTLLNNPDINPSLFTSQMSDGGYDSAGNLFSVGQLWPNGNPNPFWYVRKSSDGGATWSTLYEPDGSLYQYTPGQWVWPRGFAADGSGGIYVVGAGRSVTTSGSGKHAQTETHNHWLVRRSTDGGQSWTLVDDVIDASAAAASAVAGQGVVVAGDGWVVRKSPDGSAGSFVTVDGPIASAYATAVGSDSQGNIYVVGNQFVATGTVRNKGKTQTTGFAGWVTRRSSDGGNTWTDDDVYSYIPSTQNPNPPAATAFGITRDATGSVVVVGRASDGSDFHWIVRRRDPATGTWSSVDDYQPVHYAVALKATTDAAGNLLVTGLTNAGDGSGDHWIVRRLAANP